MNFTVWAPNPNRVELITEHRRLIRLREEQLDLISGRLEDVAVAFSLDARWLVLYRGRVAVACNFSSEERRVPLAGGQAEILLASSAGIELAGESLRLPPESAAGLR